MEFNFDERIDRSETISIKWSASQWEKMYGERDVIPMGIADMDLKTAPCVSQAIRRRAAHKTYGYGFASEEFLASCAGWQRRRHGWAVSPDWITYTPGVNMALVCAVEMFTRPGDGVIIQTPVYYPYFDYVRGTGRYIAANPLVNRGGRYEMDFDGLEALAKKPDVKLMLLCSPHNPVGRVWTREELVRVGRICIDNGVMLAVDEIHADLVFAPHRHTPFASISEEFAHSCIVCTSPSKTFNLAGLLVSDIIIPDEKIRKAFQEKMAPYYLWPGNFGAAAQIAAYTQGEQWLDALLGFLVADALYRAGGEREGEMTARRIRCKCDLYSGEDALNLPILAAGGTAVISVVANVVPKQVKWLTEEVLGGRLDLANGTNDVLLPLIHACFVEVNPIPVKAAMNILGFDAGIPRPPLTPIEPEHLSQLKAALSENYLEVTA